MFGLAAAQGKVEAQCNLGDMHRGGRGGPVDFAEARRLYGLAAAQGHSTAQKALSSLDRAEEALRAEQQADADAMMQQLLLEDAQEKQAKGAPKATKSAPTAIRTHLPNAAALKVSSSSGVPSPSASAGPASSAGGVPEARAAALAEASATIRLPRSSASRIAARRCRRRDSSEGSSSAAAGDPLACAASARFCGVEFASRSSMRRCMSFAASRGSQIHPSASCDG